MAPSKGYFWDQDLEFLMPDATSPVMRVVYRSTLASPAMQIVNRHRPELISYEEFYKHLHSHPELGGQETQTAWAIMKRLERLGLNMIRNVGGNGIICVLKNGAGPTVLVRAAMNGSPILEQTSLPYASQVCQKNHEGLDVQVMHSCGHDMQIACLLAVTILLRSARKHWSGTFIALFQPDQETAAGAQAMVNDGLYARIPIPDVILCQHIDHQREGALSIRSGPIQAAADSFHVRIYGNSGYESRPGSTIDPIVIASRIVLLLKDTVSHVLAAQDFAVVTCGSFHAGDNAASIPEYADLKVSIRACDGIVREDMISAVTQIINAECDASGVQRRPDIIETGRFPLTNNHRHIVENVLRAWKHSLGRDRVLNQERNHACDDIANLSAPYNTPHAVWFLGGTDASVWHHAMERGKLHMLPQSHSSRFAPIIQPTLRIGVDALAVAALSFLGQGSS